MSPSQGLNLGLPKTSISGLSNVNVYFLRVLLATAMMCVVILNL